MNTIRKKYKMCIDKNINTTINVLKNINYIGI